MWWCACDFVAIVDLLCVIWGEVFDDFSEVDVGVVGAVGAVYAIAAAVSGIE